MTPQPPPPTANDAQSQNNLLVAETTFRKIPSIAFLTNRCGVDQTIDFPLRDHGDLVISSSQHPLPFRLPEREQLFAVVRGPAMVTVQRTQKRKFLPDVVSTITMLHAIDQADLLVSNQRVVVTCPRSVTHQESLLTHEGDVTAQSWQLSADEILNGSAQAVSMLRKDVKSVAAYTKAEVGADRIMIGDNVVGVVLSPVDGAAQVSVDGGTSFSSQPMERLANNLALWSTHTTPEFGP